MTCTQLLSRFPQSLPLIMAFQFASMTRPQSFCIMLCITSAAVALFLIYLDHGLPFGTLVPNINNKTRTDSMAYHVKKQAIIECSDNMFASLERCLPCPTGTFSFSGWSKCEPFLNCSQIAVQVRLTKEIRGGRNKEIWLADWKGHKVVYLACPKVDRKTKCFRGMTRMEMLQGPFVTRLIGKCFEKLIIVTAHYKHGSANHLNRLLLKPQFSQYNNIQTRFQLIVDYVKIMNYMHNSPIGIRVMCDTYYLKKLLSQYLITDDFHLVANDLDNTPDAGKGNGILCHDKKEERLSVAPEQRWPLNKSVPFRLDLMPTYDEKVDIWKIPSVVESILGDVDGSSFAKSKLRKMMRRCHATNPQQRPTANEVLQEFLRVQKFISTH